jgi:hypothetical protein
MNLELGSGESMFSAFVPPRRWKVGHDMAIEISEIGELRLSTDEQVVVSGYDGPSYEIVRKSWGFYAAPSLNHRLLIYGLKGIVVTNKAGRHYFMIVEANMYQQFLKYCSEESLEILHDFSYRD